MEANEEEGVAVRLARLDDDDDDALPNRLPFEVEMVNPPLPLLAPNDDVVPREPKAEPPVAAANGLILA